MKNYIKILFLSMITIIILSATSCGETNIEIPEKSDNMQVEENNEETNSEECNHVYEEKVIVSATCEKEGISKKICTICKKAENATLPKTEHKEIEDKGILPSCTEAGISDGKHCSVCNTITVPQEPLSKIEHIEVIDEAINATCTAPGKTEGKHCSVCNTVLIEQEVITTQHSITKRTHTPVTCNTNGSIEIYCTQCETILNYETILKGHYSAEHEYSKITHTSIGNLCVGFKPGDKCEICNARFIAPGTYTIIGLQEWEGTVQFNFDYYNNLGAKQSASKITQYRDNNDYLILKFDDYIVEGYEYLEYSYERFKNYSGIIIITEEDFAIVEQTFYHVFQKYSEAGEYTLSGKYTFNSELYSFSALGCPEGIEYLNFKYLDKTGNEYYSTFIQCVTAGVETQINYSNYGRVMYFDFDEECGEFNQYIQPYVFFETPQTVSKDFFEWFTQKAKKII